MDQNQLIPKKRIEELRSRLSILQSTLDFLRQSYLTNYRSLTYKNQSPTVIFPKMSFDKLQEAIDGLNDYFNNIINNQDYSLRELINDTRHIHIFSSQILDELMRLRNILQQRTLVLGTMKISEYNPVLQSEYNILVKVFNAVDAYTYDLVKRTLGQQWIEDNGYAPLSLFDQKGYSINPYSISISVPYYDCFRARFWTNLAHEVAHVYVYEESQLPDGGLYQLMSFSSNALKNLINRHLEYFSPNRSIGTDVVNWYLTELTCDLIGTYVGGPSALFADITSLDFLSESRPLELFCCYRHPPTSVRIASEVRLLELEKFHLVDREFKELFATIQTFIEQRNLTTLCNWGNPGTLVDSYTFMEDYTQFANTYARLMYRTLRNTDVVPFKTDGWIHAKSVLKNKKYDGLTPVKIMNLAWMKRMKIVQNDAMLNLEDYLDNRKHEPKFFEDLVNLLYSYYENVTVPEIKTLYQDIGGIIQ